MISELIIYIAGFICPGIVTLKRMSECSCRLNEHQASWSYGMKCHSGNRVWGDANGSGFGCNEGRNGKVEWQNNFNSVVF